MKNVKIQTTRKKGKIYSIGIMKTDRNFLIENVKKVNVSMWLFCTLNDIPYFEKSINIKVICLRETERDKLRVKGRYATRLIMRQVACCRWTCNSIRDKLHVKSGRATKPDKCCVKSRHITLVWML